MVKATGGVALHRKKGDVSPTATRPHAHRRAQAGTGESMSPKRTYKNDALVKPLETFSARAVYGSTFCKRQIAVQILVDDGIVKDIGGSVECSYSRQCLGTLISLVKGMDVDSAWSFSGDDLKQNLEMVDPKSDCDTYVVAALRLALRNWEKGV